MTLEQAADTDRSVAWFTAGVPRCIAAECDRVELLETQNKFSDCAVIGQ